MTPEQLYYLNCLLLSVTGFSLVGGVLVQARDQRCKARQRDSELALLHKLHGFWDRVRKPTAPVGTALLPPPGKSAPGPKGVRIVVAAPRPTAAVAGPR